MIKTNYSYSLDELVSEYNLEFPNDSIDLSVIESLLKDTRSGNELIKKQIKYGDVIDVKEKIFIEILNISVFKQAILRAGYGSSDD